MFSAGLISLWVNLVAGAPQVSDRALEALWDTPALVLEGNPDPAAQAVVQRYLKGLSAKGLNPSTQGIWMQSGNALLASNQGNIPLPAASLTKVATTLAALETWKLDHQFETLVSATGPIQNGVLQGDLVIEGQGDPFFVWEEAIALGNTLNQMGIRRVTGNLLITGKFYMNYETNAVKAGTFLKQALNFQNWPGEAEAQFYDMAPGTARPQVVIAGAVVAPQLPVVKQLLLVRHQSLPLFQLLKLMNVHSNNVMSEMLAEAIGGPQAVASKAAAIAKVPPQEILLKNGSGLGADNRISPRAVCAMFVALQQYLHPPLPLVKPHTYTIGDLFPVAGRDEGTVLDRKMPFASVVKTGTLNDVSALAGVVPTRDRGLVWFAIINRGTDIEGLRVQQDQLLQGVQSTFGKPTPISAAITPQVPLDLPLYRPGAPDRNQRVMPGG